MKIGIISDIHNNMIALTAMLEKFKKEQCDKIICCGDIIGIGPYPEQTVRIMMGIPGMLAVKGNHDRYFVEEMPNEVPNDEQMEFNEMEHHRWEHSLLSRMSYDYIKALPYRIDTVIEGVKITVLHYEMNEQCKYSNYITNPSIQDCYNIFSYINSDVIIYGHDHERAINKDRKKLFINCGSLGCPSRGNNVAQGGILTINKGSTTVETIDLTYDVEEVIGEIDRLNYPDALLIKQIFYGRK